MIYLFSWTYQQKTCTKDSKKKARQQGSNMALAISGYYFTLYMVSECIARPVYKHCEVKLSAEFPTYNEYHVTR